MMQEIFRNAEVDLGQLPSAEDLSWRPLEPAYRRLLLLSTCFSCAIFVGLTMLILPFAGVPMWIPMAAVGLVLLITAVSVIAILKGFPYKGFALRARDILYRTGWLFKKQVAVPFMRVQHVDIRQGAFERLFGLYKINIYTAGGESSDITIPGLLETDAQRLKEYILRETTWRDEEE